MAARSVAAPIACSRARIVSVGNFRVIFRFGNQRVFKNWDEFRVAHCTEVTDRLFLDGCILMMHRLLQKVQQPPLHFRVLSLSSETAVSAFWLIAFFCGIAVRYTTAASECATSSESNSGRFSTASASDTAKSPEIAFCERTSLSCRSSSSESGSSIKEIVRRSAANVSR